MYTRPELVAAGQALTLVLGALVENNPDRVNGDPIVFKYTTDNNAEND